MRNIAKLDDLKNVRVLLRLDLNVSIIKGVVKDDYRIKAVMPTINFLKNKGAKIVIISHITDSPNDSLELVAEEMKLYCQLNFIKSNDFNEIKGEVDKMKSGDIVLLENLRKFSGEKANDSEFSIKLASLGEIYVNDAFATSHRAHASIVGVPNYLPSYFGLLFVEEIENLKRVIHPIHPFFFVLGGAKISSKIPLIKKYLQKADRVFVGGALSNNYMKELGYEIGKSLYESGMEKFVKDTLKNKKLVLPEDVVVSGVDGKIKVVDIRGVGKDDVIVDAGPKTIDKISEIASKSKIILWNGPLGNYKEDYNRATLEFGRRLSEIKAETIVGGGDTVSSLPDELKKEMDFVSTGGGAMLEYLLNETLPGIDAIENSLRIEI